MKLQNINISYGEDIIYKDFNMELVEGKINCLLGKSGCGKTTLLNYISSHYINNGVKVSYVFQDSSLINWINVKKNLEIILPDTLSKQEKKDKVYEVLKLVDLSDSEKKYPLTLSGGMRQRVNIARAIAYQSEVLIMDEPFKSLDVNIKNKIIKNIVQLNAVEKRTIIFVTHDLEEALELGDELLILGNRPIVIKAKFSNLVGDIREEIMKIMGD